MMKKLVALAAFAALTAGAALSFAGQAPRTGVAGSFHDITYLGAAGWSYNQDDFQRICIFCHTPHNAQPQGAVPAPLWNHDMSAYAPTPYSWAAPANLQLYVDAPFDADYLVGPSRLCESCHDGTVAVDSHGPTVGTAQGNNNGNHLMTSPGRVISDMTITHPIGFVYDLAQASRGADEIRPSTSFFIDTITAATGPTAPTTYNTFNTRTLAGATYTTRTIASTLYGGYMTCASCHEVHNTNNSANDPSVSNPAFTPNYFVWAREQGSALCLSCHVK